MDRKNRNIIKGKEDLNNILIRPNEYIQNIPPKKGTEYTFSHAHKTDFRISYMLGHKIYLNKFRKMKSYKVSSLTATE